MSGDVLFEPELQRCINVDVRYVLFVIDKFAGAGHLLDEMNDSGSWAYAGWKYGAGSEGAAPPFRSVRAEGGCGESYRVGRKVFTVSGRVPFPAETRKLSERKNIAIPEMLERLSIENYALIQQLELELSPFLAEHHHGRNGCRQVDSAGALGIDTVIGPIRPC